MNESDRPILDEFGKLMIEHVRDATMSDQQALVSGKLVSRENKELYRALESLELRPEEFEIVGRLLTKAVEATMNNFLVFFESNNFGIIYRDDEEREHDIQAMSDGLAGELYSESGWIARFSKFKKGAAITRLK